jgi:hypothetical protein
MEQARRPLNPQSLKSETEDEKKTLDDNKGNTQPFEDFDSEHVK